MIVCDFLSFPASTEGTVIKAIAAMIATTVQKRDDTLASFMLLGMCVYLGAR